MGNKINKDDIILFVTKVLSWIINLIIFLVVVGLFVGGIYLLYLAITA